jgi:hypothetical protein
VIFAADFAEHPVLTAGGSLKGTVLLIAGGVGGFVVRLGLRAAAEIECAAMSMAGTAGSDEGACPGGMSTPPRALIDEPRWLVVGQVDGKHQSVVVTYREQRVRTIFRAPGPDGGGGTL